MSTYRRLVVDRAANAWKHPPTRAFCRTLADGQRPSSILVQGDSTGNGTDEWVYLLAQRLGGRFPAYGIEYRLWDDTGQGWGA
jgi:hypothetical protein